MALSLLDEKCFTIKPLFGKKSEEVLSLPELFQALCQDKPFSMPKLQAVQQHGVYSFLANLIALCLDHEIDVDDNKSPISVDVLRDKTADDWKQLLVNLSGEDKTAFDLIVEDMSKPAFFQPPTQIELVGDDVLSSKGQPTRDTPDNFSISHDKQDFDVKRSRNSKDDVELWIYALIVMQTCCNYGGRTWNATIKIESGEATRICASYVDKPFFNVRIQRDVPLLLANRSNLIDVYGYRSQFKLLWLVERTEKNQIDLQDCHPLFIDCARIYRFTQTQNNINVFGVGRDLEFIKDAKGYRGVVGDFWLPITKMKKDGIQTQTAMSLKKDGLGFDYKQTTNILLNNEIKTPAISLSNEKTKFKQGFLLLEGVRGGQCKTAGFHRKYVVMTKGMVSRFSKTGKDANLTEQIQNWMSKYFDYIALVWEYLVKKALEIKGQTDRLLKWETIFTENKVQYEDRVETFLFEALYKHSELDESAEKIEQDFVNSLDQLAFDIREHLFQRFFANSNERYFYFCLLNASVYKQKLELNKKISLLEVKPHMSQIRISMRPRIYAQVSDALRLIHTNAQNNTFLSNLRTMNVYAVPELNPTYQEMIAQIYGQSLKNANLSEKEIQLWQHLFSWMRTSKKTNSQDNLGTLCGKADVKGYRLLSTLQQSEESLIVAVSSLVSMIKSTKLEISTQAWVDIASLLFSEGTEDEVNVRKKIANDYYHHELNEKTPKKPKTTETTETMATTESNNMEQTNG